MRYRTLGPAGLLVSEICLGTMTFGGRGPWTAIGTLDQSVADRLLQRSLDAGVNFIDTADVYSEGLSEEITGRAIRNSGRPRSDIALAYVLAKPFVTSVVIGARSLEQLDDNLAAVDLRLDEREMAGLDSVSALPPEYPGWMIEFQAARESASQILKNGR